MGNWTIVIHGYGPHHNKDYPLDADRFAAKFLAELYQAGHKSRVVFISSDGIEEIHLPEDSTEEGPVRLDLPPGPY